jgi:methionine-rich copper-binding protein CopC
MKRIFIVALGATLLALGAFGIASAHATLDHCMPALGSTVASAPAQIVCVYSEEIDSKRSTMGVWDANGNEVDKKDARLDLNDANHATLLVSLDTTRTPKGLYTIKWRTVTPDDNGLSYGSWQFVIGSANAVPYQPTQVLDGEANAQGTALATAAVTPATGTPAATNAPAAAAATATPSATAVPAATATTAAPTTAPATGAPENNAWMLFALLGIVVVLGGTILRIRR